MLPSRVVVVAGSVFVVVAALASAAAAATTSDVVVRRSFVFGGFSPGDDETTRRSFVVVDDASSTSVPPRSSTRGLLAESEIVSIRGGGGGDEEDESYDDEYDEYDDAGQEEEERDDDEYEVEYDDDVVEEEEEVSGEAEEEAVAEEMEDSLNAAVDLAVGCAKKIGVILGRATVEASRAVQRAAEAGLAAAKEDEEREELGEEEEEGREVASIAAKLGRLLSRMWEAAVCPPPPKGEQEATTAMGDDGVVCVDGEVFRKEGRRGAERPARSRGVDDDRGSGGTSTTILGGTLTDALQSARSEARLLVAFVPASRRKSSSYDQIAVSSLTSPDVKKIVDRRPVKTKKKDGGKKVTGGGGGGSFAIWSAASGSKEASNAVKRLKVKTPSNKKSPILAVAYPAQVLDRTTGRPKLVPRLLAQHHCNPPPNPSSLASWLDALRKRHAKQYGSMLRELQEMEYHRERREGYKSSVSGDREREQREQAEAKRREEERRREKERLKQLERRREALKESLPPEPSADDRNAMTIALRFVDGRTGRRRFDPETDLNVLFDWVDAEYGMERERVTLTTMDGRKSFEFREGGSDEDVEEEEEEGAWEVQCGTTLREAGLKRMTALRVSERKEEEEETEEEDDEEEVDR